MLSEDKVQELSHNLEKIKKLNSYYSEKQSRSLKYLLTISDDTDHQTIRWDHFSALPKVLKNLSESASTIL